MRGNLELDIWPRGERVANGIEVGGAFNEVRV